MTPKEKRNRIWQLEDSFQVKEFDLKDKADRAKASKHKYLHLAQKSDIYFKIYFRCQDLWMAILHRERGWTKKYEISSAYRRRLEKKEEGRKNYLNHLINNPHGPITRN